MKRNEPVWFESQDTGEISYGLPNIRDVARSLLYRVY